MTSEEFLAEVSAQIHGSTAHKKQALDDLRDLLNAGISPEELGDPREYAAMVSSETEQPSRYGRVWDPTNPKLFVPRVIGFGWDLNLGALAVKLGWLRPDDIDSDVIGAAPEWAMRLSAGLPVMGAAIALSASAVAASRSDGMLPSGWDSAFRPNKYSGTVAALAPGIILSAGAALWAGMSSGRDDQIFRSVFATSLSFMGAGVAFMAARSTWRGRDSQPVAGVLSVLVAPPALSLAAGLVPVRAGLTRIWKEAGLHVQH